MTDDATATTATASDDSTDADATRSAPATDAPARPDGSSVPIPETRVPDDETPAARCRYCDRPFRSQRQHDLHLGHAHEGVWTDDERAAYERAVDDESEELWVYHIKVVAALGVIYAAFVLSYTVVASA